jgi:hypothetical protein
MSHSAMTPHAYLLGRLEPQLRAVTEAIASGVLAIGVYTLAAAALLVLAIRLQRPLAAVHRKIIGSHVAPLTVSRRSRDATHN